MKRSIFIAIHYLELGGAEISLIGLLQSLDYGKYDVDLFVYSHRGELMEFIPKEVNLLPEIPEYAQIERPLKDVIRDGYWKIALARLKAKMQFRRYVRRNHPKDGSAVFQYVSSAVSPYLPSLEHLGEYDLAISFLTPHNIVLEKVNAKKKAAWIHTDYSRIDVDTDLELPVWSGFDHIVSISPEVTKAFVSRFPSLEPKIIEMENILSAKFVRERAELIFPQVIAHEMKKKEGETILLSVGRFCEAKNYDNVPDICRRIIEAGCPVKWYLIGYGGDEPLIRRKITEAGMEGKVIILGKGWMSILAQPSGSPVLQIVESIDAIRSPPRKKKMHVRPHHFIEMYFHRELSVKDCNDIHQMCVLCLVITDDTSLPVGAKMIIPFLPSPVLGSSF